MNSDHRLRALVAYDGAPFHGFAVNPGVSTVAGRLTEALETLAQRPVVLTCAGRTDRGVHGWGQVVSFDFPADGPPTDEIQRALNRLCGPAVVVRAVERANPGFDARFDAIARIYRYRIVEGPVADPFRAATHWHLQDPLDLSSLRAAAVPLLGEHEFSSFCRRPKPGPDGTVASLIRRVVRAEWSRDADTLTFEIEASSFCQQMVRAVVGTLVEVGSGRRRAGDMTAVMAAGDRTAAGQLAPPHGLMLWRVRYREPVFASVPPAPTA